MNPTNRPDLDPDAHPITLDLPPHFYEHLAHALGTADPALLGVAETGYRGTFPSAHDYILTTLAGHLPATLSWLGACLDPDRTLAHYEAGRLAVWTIPLTADAMMVFESSRRGSGPAFTIPYQGHRLRVFADPAPE